MRLMQLTTLGRFFPASFRRSLRQPWDWLLRYEQFVHERRFYRRFVKAGDLVFDIGANSGEKTAALLSLGLRVVAVEPNVACAQVIERTHKSAIEKGTLHVEKAAVAAKSGKIVLTLFDCSYGMVSASPDFLNYARQVGYTGEKSITAPAVTADQLVSRYGLPQFMKIDVEGMDAEVLRGLTSKPSTLSFEYNTAPELIEGTRSCFRECSRLAFTEANLTQMTSPQLVFAEWRTLESIERLLEDWAVASPPRWGDVIVR